VTDYGMDDWGLIAGRNKDYSFRHQVSYTMDNGSCIPGEKAACTWKWPPLSSDEVKNAWSFTTTLP